MFTGIVQIVGRVAELRPNPFGLRLLIDAGDWTYRPASGDSIAVNGVCLTYVSQGSGGGVDTGGRGRSLSFDVIKETLERTTLGRLKVGDAVNLESSLTPSSPMGGHFVQGHVDGRGMIARVHAGADEWRITVQVEPVLLPYIVPKGSVAIDGVSLTVASVDVAANRFTVALIPTTLRVTTLGRAKVGDSVNLETDLINRAVVHALSLMREQGGVTLGRLREAGF